MGPINITITNFFHSHDGYGMPITIVTKKGIAQNILFQEEKDTI